MVSIDWADGASTGLAGMGSAGMGSWLSDFLKNNKNTLATVLGGAIGGAATVIGQNIIGGVARPTTTPTQYNPSAPATLPVSQAKKETNWLPIAAVAGVGLLLLARR